MSVLQIKNELIGLIAETDDVVLLEKVRLYFQDLREETFSVEWNKRIEEAENQEGTSYEVFKEKYDL